MSLSNLSLDTLYSLGLKKVFDDINTRMETYEKELNELRSTVNDMNNKIDELKLENQSLDTMVENLKMDIRMLEWQSDGSNYYR